MKKLLVILLGAFLLFGCSSPQSGNVTKATNVPALTNASSQFLNQSGASTIRVAKGDVVYLDYVARTYDGVVYDTSVESVAKQAKLPLTKFAPVMFTIGNGQLLPAVEEQVVGMGLGEAKSIMVPPEKAFGLYSRQKVARVPLSYFGANSSALKVGSTVTYNKTAAGVIIDIFQNYSLVDFNPPLAGQTLVFEVAVKNVTKSG